MSLVYALFGIPKNFDDILNKAEKKIMPVDVVTKLYDIMNQDNQHIGYGYHISTKLDRTEVSMGGVNTVCLSFSEGGWVANETHRSERDMKATNHTGKIAKKIRDRGLEVRMKTIEGEKHYVQTSVQQTD